MKLDDIRQGVGALWDSVAEGWDRLRQTTAGALTRYRPANQAGLPRPDEVDDASYVPSASWAMLGGDVFEDDKRIVVRLEAPGMAKGDFDIQVLGDALVVRGEKRFERESTAGRWRVLQCAYGSFLRTVPLPAPVKEDESRATYRQGVLKVELVKQKPGKPSVTQITVH
ncbi:Hsp20/alpha crystallin family protein [Ideonella sp. A 288]|uniref:Hsp20/alpha crystallin family protein n=1 Tax=Ideonella sp. A 288 TaxID=1962181 RepID=UPI000B4C11F6|nr:Hsp20/alpha crystallin family protein [Ideonella sp. A 288]